MGGIRDIAFDRMIEHAHKLLDEVARRYRALDERNMALQALQASAAMKPPPQDHRYETATEFQRAPTPAPEPSIADLLREITSLKEMVGRGTK